MYAIYGNMDPINIPHMLAYIPAPWILWDLVYTESKKIAFSMLKKKIVLGRAIRMKIKKCHVSWAVAAT